MTTQLVDDRDMALRVGFKATDWVRTVLFVDYLSAMESWTIKAILRDGMCIGAVYSNNGEVHASVLPEWRGKWATKGLLREMFNGPVVTTQVVPGHEFMFGILERLGFRKEDSKWVLNQH